MPQHGGHIAVTDVVGSESLSTCTPCCPKDLGILENFCASRALALWLISTMLRHLIQPALPVLAVGRDRLFGKRASVDKLGAETGWRGYPFYAHGPQVLTPSLMGPLLLCTGSLLAQRQPQVLALSRGRCPCSQHAANRTHPKEGCE